MEGANILDLGPAVRSLVAVEGGGIREMPLTPAAPVNCPQLRTLRRSSAADLFDGNPVRSTSDAKCVQSGLYLYFSALDESHAISQGIHTRSGSYWHGIMHRQEGDWANAKYWFRRVGSHPVLAALEREAAQPWDAFAFVDRCAAASAGREDEPACRRLQALEWTLLLGHCYRKALGR